MFDFRKALTLAAAAALLVCACAQACFMVGDFNNDCKVDIEDLSLLALQWLAPPPLCSETDLAGHWKLDEAGGILAVDASGHGRTGDVEGDAVWQPGGGYLAGALAFDGTDDAVRITGYRGITGQNPRTCAAWIRTYHADVEILTWGDGATPGRRWVLCIQQDGLLRLKVGSGSVDGSTYVNDGEWHHVAATFEGTTTDDVRLFVDGIMEIVSDQIPRDISTSGAEDVCIGIFDGSGGYFRGAIDDVRIYERAMTMEEVWALARTDTADVTCVDVHAGDGVNLEDFARLAGNWLRETSPVLINEFMADNESTLATTVEGEEVFADWIELYNASSLTIDLEGWYLTDKRDDLTQWAFPAEVVLEPGEYLVVFASEKEEADYPGNYPYVDNDGHLHTNFKLSNNGEYLALVRSDGQTVAHEYAVYEFAPYEFGFPPQENDVSYGMFYDEMRYFAIPTPGGPNNGAFMGYVGDTAFSHDRGFYDGAFELRIRCETPGAVIRYTTDGSTPTEAGHGTRYAGPILIDRTTTLRAMAYKPGWAAGNVDTQTYLFINDVIGQSPNGEPPSPLWPSSNVNGQILNYGMDPDVVDSEEYAGLIDDALAAIPAISIVTDLGNLFDPAAGIYVNADRDGREWERPASVELLNPDGSQGFHVNAGLRIRGGYSRQNSNPKHAFRLFFRGEYGSPELDFPLFGDEGVGQFQKMDLRTAQNYSWSFSDDGHNTMCREVFSRDMQRDMGQPYTRSRYYHLYLDGHYWGIFQTEERPEARYATSYFAGEVDDYDVVKVDAGPGRPYTIEATDGNLDACKRLWDAAAAGFKTDKAYFGIQGLDPNGLPDAERERLVDVDNLIDYMISTFYVGDCDSPISWFLGNTRPNNYYGIYNRVDPDGFKFFRHDAEHSLFSWSRNYDRTGPYPAGANFVHFNPQWLHQKLAEHGEYRVRFGDRAHNTFFNNGLLTPGQAAAGLMTRADQIDTAIIAESARWGDSKRPDEPFTKADWLQEIDGIVDAYFPGRTGIVLGQFRGKKWYPSVEAPRFHINGLHRHGGHISTEDFVSMSAPEGRIFYTIDGSDPRLPESAMHFVTAALFDPNAPKRVHVPLGPEDGFINPPKPNVGHWKLDNNYSDSAQRPGEDPPIYHDGTPYGNVHFAPNRNGDENTAARFDGKDDFVYISSEDTDVFDIIDNITISCWVKYSVHHAQAGIVTKGTSSWMLCQAAADGKLRFSLAGVGNLVSDSTWDDDKWHHVAAVRRYDKMILYVDGAADGTRDVDPLADIALALSWHVFIGSNHELWYDEINDVIRDIDSFEGEIDDVRIYSRALTPADIAKVMTEGEFWANADYDDSQWQQGTGGVGYEIASTYFDPYIGIDVQESMYDANSTCCIRIPFTLDPDLGEIASMTLRIRYDDGFVAYLNGYEVARANFWDEAAWDSTAVVDRPNAEAVEPREFDLSRFRHLLRPGLNVFGILGINFSSSNPDYLTWAELLADERVVVSDTATLYTEAFTLDKSRIVKARTLGKSGEWSALNEAPYAVGPVAESLRITEIMYHPADVDDTEPNSEFIELRNVGDETINLNLVRFTDGVDFTFGEVELESGDFVLVVAGRAEFEEAYPDFDGLIAGEYEGRLDNAGEKIRLADAFGRTICEFKYQDAWYDITDGDGFSLTLRSEPQQRLQELDALAVAHWRLDERSSDTAPDSSGNDHTALLFGEPVWRYAWGMIDGAMLFDGIDDYVQAEEYAGIGGSADRTCAAWIRTRAGGAIVAWGEPGSGAKWAVVVTEDGLLQVQAGGGGITGSTVINDGRWRHVAAVSDTGGVEGIQLYVDGRPDLPSEMNSGSISTSSDGLVTLGAFSEDGPFFAGLIDDVRICAEALDASSVEAIYSRGKYPGDKQYWRPSARMGGSPGDDDTGTLPEPGDVQIHEVLAHSHAAASDWIELRNATDSTITIGGWFLSDSKDDYRKFEIPAGASLGPGGYAVFYENLHFGNSGYAGCRTPFGLSENGETLYLRSGLDNDGNLTGYYEEEAFDASETGVAFGRYLKSEGTYNFVAMSANTPNGDNTYPKVGPVVISEFMYDPTPGGTWDHNEYEYVELLNISPTPVVMQELDNETHQYVPWRFTDGIDFEFPLGAVLGPGERLLLVKNPSAFLERYGDPGVVVLGPYDGRLDNNGEKLTLSKPGDAVGGHYYYIRVDRVVYENTRPWPVEAAGVGKALERITPSDYGNDAVNWQAADPTPGL
jgi:hypothetical protein